MNEMASSSTMKVIYQPAGRAREYAELACNLYSGCDHGCTYCYAPLALKRSREQFAISAIRKDILKTLEKDCREMSRNKDPRSVLLSFTCDAYQHLDSLEQITRAAIQILIRHGIHFTILTKGGNRSLRDLDLLTAHKDLVTYAATLVFTNEDQRRQYEPNAAPTNERIICLKTMHDSGITTWVSLEPVFDPNQSLDLIRQTHEFVDLYKVGKVNYMKEGKEIDWHAFVHNATSLLESLGKKYYIKNDLKQFI